MLGVTAGTIVSEMLDGAEIVVASTAVFAFECIVKVAHAVEMLAVV